MQTKKNKEIINYIPIIRENPNLFKNKLSAWEDIPQILKDIIVRFKIEPNIALEFGTEFGYSTSALSNYFKKVIGVDIFTGDIHSGIVEDHYEETKTNLKSWENIELIKSDYKDYIKDNENKFDLIHIDIVHTYDETYECGEWAINHSNLVIFHDTQSFPDIKRVCLDLSAKYDLEFYNYEKSNGLGILYKNEQL